MCVCRPKPVSGTDNSLTSAAMLFRVSSFAFDICITFLFPDAFSKGAVIPTCSRSSEIAVTLVAFCPENAFIDLISNRLKMHFEFCLQPYQQYYPFPCQSFQ